MKKSANLAEVMQEAMQIGTPPVTISIKEPAIKDGWLLVQFEKAGANVTLHSKRWDRTLWGSVIPTSTTEQIVAKHLNGNSPQPENTITIAELGETIKELLNELETILLDAELADAKREKDKLEELSGGW